ncbi:MAG TPA: cytochrome c maturation protein CcmE [Flavobacteriales bacterium]|nr:cytochrome c maturation protein CcmE [Flavobacteriales bacterium]
MKISAVIALLVVVIAGSIIFTSVSGQSRYSDFSDAFKTPGEKITVIGKLNREKQMIDLPNHMEFYVVDENHRECKVIYNKTKPQDFERSEKIVMTGVAHGNTFVANELLLKCPSKYNTANNN